MPTYSQPLNPAILQVVVGLGKTGVSCVRYLLGQNSAVAVTDSRENPPGLAEIRRDFPHIPLFLGKLDAELCSQAARLIVSPGVSLLEPAITKASAAGVKIIGDIELFAQQAKAPIIAITGSNGKSTVTTLVGEMAHKAGLNVKVGGNLGIPVLDLLIEQPVDLYVLELSSFQLETTFSLRPQAAVLLNLCADHMDRYQQLSDYLAAKQRIYQHCHTLIVNRDEPLTWQNLATSPAAHCAELTATKLANSISFGLDVPQGQNFGLLQVQGQTYLAKGPNRLIKTSALKIKGRHQLANALAALALGEAVGLPMAAMLSALLAFEGLAHRCQWLAQSGGVDWYNDSKATNVGAAQAALAGLGPEITGKLVVIAGGQGKNADFSPLRQTLTDYARCLILIGQDAPLMTTALEGSVPIQQAASLEQAIAIAHSQAKSGDAVILAPACASFDMFANFEQRGERFSAAVKVRLSSQ